MARMMKVELATTEDGEMIVQDVHDMLGRLLVRAPRRIDPELKRMLLARGIQEVFIPDRSSEDAEHEKQIVALEREAIRKRFSRLPDTPDNKRIVDIFIRAFEVFHAEKGKIPPV